MTKARSKVHVAADNLAELVGAGLMSWGIYMVAGRGASIVCAATSLILLANFSWTGHTWSLPLPRLPRIAVKTKAFRALRMDRALVRSQLKKLSEPDPLGGHVVHDLDADPDE